MLAHSTFNTNYDPDWYHQQADKSGATLILDECKRQHKDALSTLIANNDSAKQIADSITTQRNLFLLGMGASHFANEIAAARFRALGIDAFAIPASEALYNPIPRIGNVILTSQSGGSIEVIKWLEQNRDTNVIAGVTLNPNNPFGNVPTLVGAGGAEKAFAATRSFSLTIAAFSGVLKHMGASDDDLISSEEPTIDPNVEALVSNFDAANTFVFAGRAALDGLAKLAALSAMELGQLPALGYEAGQFRHGPIEFLSPSIGVVFFRAPGMSAHAWRDLAQICDRAGAPTLIFDASGEEPLKHGLTVQFSSGNGMKAVYEMQPTLQALLLGIAAKRVSAISVPRFCSKVTDTE